ncbi:hypothetical protein WJX84_005043 [Apatococcus fuscideae]|uniref:Protein YIP n=1 Tax=Apatococcus fuscideae TaxID=2026836 RepID=A0AAW1T9Z0_9CHLO
MSQNRPGNAGFSEDVERLFQHDTSVPSVPVPTHEPSSFGGSDLGGGHSPTSAHHLPLNTLDEPVWETILRDVKRIYGNLKLVVFPFGTRDQQTTALRNWDLWGPMTFALVLSICLAVGTDEHQQTVFSLVFGTLSVGAVVLTFNVILLGGNIGFFQAMCLLGYCIFPIDIAAIVCAATRNVIARWVIVLVALAWSSWASVPFVGSSVSPSRKALAVGPPQGMQALLKRQACRASWDFMGTMHKGVQS